MFTSEYFLHSAMNRSMPTKFSISFFDVRLRLFSTISSTVFLLWEGVSGIEDLRPRFGRRFTFPKKVRGSGSIELHQNYSTYYRLKNALRFTDVDFVNASQIQC